MANINRAEIFGAARRSIAEILRDLPPAGNLVTILLLLIMTFGAAHAQQAPVVPSGDLHRDGEWHALGSKQSLTLQVAPVTANKKLILLALTGKTDDWEVGWIDAKSSGWVYHDKTIQDRPLTAPDRITFTFEAGVLTITSHSADRSSTTKTAFTPQDVRGVRFDRRVFTLSDSPPPSANSGTGTSDSSTTSESLEMTSKVHKLEADLKSVYGSFGLLQIVFVFVLFYCVGLTFLLLHRTKSSEGMKPDAVQEIVEKRIVASTNILTSDIASLKQRIDDLPDNTDVAAIASPAHTVEAAQLTDLYREFEELNRRIDAQKTNDGMDVLKTQVGTYLSDLRAEFHARVKDLRSETDALHNETLAARHLAERVSKDLRSETDALRSETLAARHLAERVSTEIQQRLDSIADIHERAGGTTEQTAEAVQQAEAAMRQAQEWATETRQLQQTIEQQTEAWTAQVAKTRQAVEQEARDWSIEVNRTRQAVEQEVRNWSIEVNCTRQEIDLEAQAWAVEVNRTREDMEQRATELAQRIEATRESIDLEAAEVQRVLEEVNRTRQIAAEELRKTQETTTSWTPDIQSKIEEQTQQIMLELMQKATDAVASAHEELRAKAVQELEELAQTVGNSAYKELRTKAVQELEELAQATTTSAYEELRAKATQTLVELSQAVTTSAYEELRTKATQEIEELTQTVANGRIELEQTATRAQEELDREAAKAHHRLEQSAAKAQYGLEQSAAKMPESSVTPTATTPPDHLLGTNGTGPVSSQTPSIGTNDTTPLPDETPSLPNETPSPTVPTATASLQATLPSGTTPFGVLARFTQFVHIQWADVLAAVEQNEPRFFTNRRLHDLDLIFYGDLHTLLRGSDEGMSDTLLAELEKARQKYRQQLAAMGMVRIEGKPGDRERPQWLHADPNESVPTVNSAQAGTYADIVPGNGGYKLRDLALCPTLARFYKLVAPAR